MHKTSGIIALCYQLFSSQYQHQQLHRNTFEWAWNTQLLDRSHQETDVMLCKTLQESTFIIDPFSNGGLSIEKAGGVRRLSWFRTPHFQDLWFGELSASTGQDGERRIDHRLWAQSRDAATQ